MSRSRKVPQWLAIYRGDHFDRGERLLDGVESSWADFAHGVRTGNRFFRDGRVGEKIKVFALEDVALQFDAYRERFEAGNPTALLEALAYAAEENVPMPYWLNEQVRRRINRVFNHPVSLHQAFELEGELPSSGKKATTSRRRMREVEALGALVDHFRLMDRMSFDQAVRKALSVCKVSFGRTVATVELKARDEIIRVHSEKMPGARRVVSSHRLGRKSFRRNR